MQDRFWFSFSRFSCYDLSREPKRGKNIRGIPERPFPQQGKRHVRPEWRNLVKIMVSACLLGRNCKYNGGNNRHEKLLRLLVLELRLLLEKLEPRLLLEKPPPPRLTLELLLCPPPPPLRPPPPPRWA